jgi:hypothetical protein
LKYLRQVPYPKRLCYEILLKNQVANGWEPIDSLEYNEEKELQKLLADSPSLISIEEIKENIAPLIIGVREIGLPGSGYTDILAFNESGDIAIIECKLAQNTEIKRKVVAQVLEYSAYLWNMSYDDLNQIILQRSKKNLVDLVKEKVIDPNWDEETFRLNLQNNLNSGTFLIIIAVDYVNDELLKTARFVNGCGNPSFSFSILEIQHYKNESTEILVPHMISSLISPRQSQQTVRKRWDENLFFETAKEIVNPEVFIVMKDLFDWVRKKPIEYGLELEKTKFIHFPLYG